jgi:hypothetical protein
LLAMDSRAPRLSSLRASSLTIIASRLAPTGDGLKGAAFIQFAHVIVDDHREQARSYRDRVNLKKKPRDRMRRRAKKLVGCGQPKELFESRYLLATVSGCQPPPRAL